MIRATTLFRYGIILTMPTLLALCVLSASPASAATGAAHPSAPRDVTATAGHNTAIVRFIAPISNGGSRVTGYYIEEYGRNSAIRRCDSTRCAVLGLSNGVHYRFAVAAINRFGRSPYSAPSNVVSPTTPVAATSTVTFDANGGSGAMTNETEPKDTTAALTLNTFTYTGYSFTGWNSEANGDGTSFTDGELAKFTGSVTLYAQWAVGPPTSTVVFLANGGTGTMQNETVSVAATLTLNSFTRTGYTFNDWNTTANGSGTSYADGAMYAFTTSTTLYARWTATSVIVPSEGQNPNWSGYILPTTSLDTEVTGEWTVPTLNCADTPNGSSSTWVGTGGNTWSNGTSSGALLQTGVEDGCVNGVQQDSGWWEIVPATPNNEQLFSNFPVNPGDTILAEVYQATSGRWVSVVQDLTTGLQGVMETGNSWYVTTIANSTLIGGVQGDASGYSYSGAYSVEWIEEDVTSAVSGSLFTLPNYGSVTFFNLKTSILTGWSLSASDANEIVGSNGAVLSVPGAVINEGFTVTYTGP